MTFILNSATSGTYVLGDGEYGLVTQNGAIGATGTAIFSDIANDASVTNLGVISTFGFFRTISLGGQGSEIFNSGTITGSNDAIYFSFAGSINSFSNSTLVNSGSISSSANHGVYFRHYSISLQNSGSIYGRDSAVTIGSPTGGSSVSAQNVMSNSGTLSTSATYAIQSFAGLNRLDNSGDIFGGVRFVTSQYEPTSFSLGDKVVNSGLITGNVLLGAVADMLINTGNGTIAGYVDGEAGNDTLRGAAGDEDFRGGTDDDLLTGAAGDDSLDGGSGADELRGGSGDDLLFGGEGGDTLDGQSGADSIHGGDDADHISGGADDDRIWGDDAADRLSGDGGNDDLFGGAGQDTVLGGAGLDMLDGGKGNDLIKGGADDDILIGDNGNDTLRGGTGNDTITGGAGADELSGGAGADEFDFDSVADSAIGASPDVITDFGKGADRIDLSDVAAGLEFVGTGAHSGTGLSVRYSKFSGTDKTVVRVDADGDGTADMKFELAGLHNLTADDFIF